jgi:hypothetical protein
MAMTFARQPTNRWLAEVPGSRWFRADLHVHTIDDLPGGRARMPSGMSGDPSDPGVLRQYARVILTNTVAASVQVLGLTPHAVQLGNSPETCAVWHIVDVWNTENDNDGVPFREKIYAVFPGFEPNVNDGGSGVHLVFLFDPEIGRDRYLRLFDAIMDARKPWENDGLRLTTRDAKTICQTIDDRQHESESTDSPWNYLVLAPHFQSHHGVLAEVKSQVLETFPCQRLAGYELGEEKLPTDFNETEKPGLFLLPFMAKHRQAFFHASDAYGIGSSSSGVVRNMGHRTTWFKLASPRIEALRQAFIASESRLRIAYERAEDNILRQVPEPPDPLQGTRPWLRRVTICGEAAFFGGKNEEGPRKVTVDMSPDLTCIIGGSMTGKSTLLDGLRVHVDAEMPNDDRLYKDVTARGRDRFLAGQPFVELDTPGGGTDHPHERWPAIFFTQNELQLLAKDPRAVEDILSRLAPAERETIMRGKDRLTQLDATLTNQAQDLEKLLDEHAEVEQQLTTAHEARSALEDFKNAGLETMQASEHLHGHVGHMLKQAKELQEQVQAIAIALGEATIDTDTETLLRKCLERMKAQVGAGDVGTLHARAVETVKKAAVSIEQWATVLSHTHEVVSSAVVVDRQTIERKLAEMGHNAEKLAEFQTLNRKASMLSSYEAACAESRAKVIKAREVFQRDYAERTDLVMAQRKAFDRVKQEVERQFNERIRISRVDYGISEGLEQFLFSFKQKGITQWWNGLDPQVRPNPEQLFDKLENGGLLDLGMSRTVVERFQEVFSEAKKYMLQALRNQDKYILELLVGDDEYREADRLSGGKRVSLLLSLLLEAHDERPLVIDQPEDELDNRFLWETVLPALRRLKGRRQVIVATHNANIVVNGDADLVVQLEADAEHGSVAVVGAIENPVVRTAIVETVDGGEKAFELRKAKYGF